MIRGDSPECNACKSLRQVCMVIQAKTIFLVSASCEAGSPPWPSSDCTKSKSLQQDTHPPIKLLQQHQQPQNQNTQRHHLEGFLFILLICPRPPPRFQSYFQTSLLPHAYERLRRSLEHLASHRRGKKDFVSVFLLHSLSPRMH